MLIYSENIKGIRMKNPSNGHTISNPDDFLKSLIGKLSSYFLEQGNADFYEGILFKYNTFSELDEETGKVKQVIFLENKEMENTDSIETFTKLRNIKNKRSSILKNNYLRRAKLLDEFGFEVLFLFQKIIGDNKDDYFLKAFLEATNIELNEIEDGIFVSDKISISRKGENIFRISGVELTANAINDLTNNFKNIIEDANNNLFTELSKNANEKLAESFRSIDFHYDLFYPIETSRNLELYILTIISENGIKMPLCGFQIYKKIED